MALSIGQEIQELRNRFKEEMLKPRKISRDREEQLQDLGYISNEFVKGTPGARNIFGGLGGELPETPATVGGQAAGFVANMIPMTAIGGVAGNSLSRLKAAEAMNKGRFYAGKGKMAGNVWGSTKTGAKTGAKSGVASKVVNSARNIDEGSWVMQEALMRKKTQLMGVLDRIGNSFGPEGIAQVLKQINNIDDAIAKLVKLRG